MANNRSHLTDIDRNEYEADHRVPRRAEGSGSEVFNGIANSRQENSFYQLTQIMVLSQSPVLLIVVL